MTALNINATYGLVVLKNFEPVYMDDHYAQIYGYDSAKELITHTESFLDLIAPEYHTLARDNYYQQVQGITPPRGRTFKNIDRFGREFTVFTIDHVIEWEGEPAMQVTVIDLSMIDRAQAQLRDSERQYKRLILSSLQGIAVHRDFQPLMVNQAWVDLLRAPSKEFVLNQRSLLGLLAEQERQSAIERYQALITGKIDSAHTLLEVVCFDGETRYFNLYDNRVEWYGQPAIQAVIEDVTQKVMLEKELAYKAHHDSLTGIWNRDAVTQWFDETLVTTRALVCLLLDIDDFKSVNDRYGHVCGDVVIRRIAEVCQNTLPEHGVIARWGGEEFVILVTDVSDQQARALAETIRQRCSAEVIEYGTHRIRRTVSLGMAYANVGEERPSMTTLIQQADSKLYHAKLAGKNQVVA